MSLRLIAQKLLTVTLFFFVATLVIFLIVDILPGDPAEMMLGTNARPDTLAALRHELGLDRPNLHQYAAWILGIVHFDFGTSMTYATPVTTLIAERLPVSLPLAVSALLLTAVLALPFGAWAAQQAHRPTDRIIRTGMQILLALPNMWIALILILIFAVTLHWVPAGGFPGWQKGLLEASKSLILPLFALALPQAAILARIARAEILDKAQDNFVLGARARGLTESDILIRHILPNALLPILSVMGLQFAFLLAGTIIIETTFSLPGLGRLIFQSVTQRDLPVIKGAALCLVGSVMIINTCVDALQILIDPRLRRRGDLLS